MLQGPYARISVLRPHDGDTVDFEAGEQSLPQKVNTLITKTSIERVTFRPAMTTESHGLHEPARRFLGLGIRTRSS